MEQLTVKELAEALTRLVAMGHGDKKIVVADDTEGNAYHGVYYAPTFMPEDVAECIDCSNGLYDSRELNPKNIVIIG